MVCPFFLFFFLQHVGIGSKAGCDFFTMYISLFFFTLFTFYVVLSVLPFVCQVDTFGVKEVLC